MRERLRLLGHVLRMKERCYTSPRRGVSLQEKNEISCYNEDIVQERNLTEVGEMCLCL